MFGMLRSEEMSIANMLMVFAMRSPVLSSIPIESRVSFQRPIAS